MRNVALACTCVLVFVACGGTQPTNLFEDGGSDGQGGQGDSSAIVDGSPTIGPDGAPITPIQLACGASTCTVPPDSCCVLGDQPSCSPTCPANAVTLKCVSSSDCPTAEVCCIHQVQNTHVSTCQTTCSNGAVLCDPNNPVCPNGQQCRADKAADVGLPTNGKFGICGG